MKKHYCIVDKAWISYEGVCNWCGDKENMYSKQQNSDTFKEADEFFDKARIIARRLDSE
jgi:hypothetical protein